MNYITIDLETYYDKAFSLSKLSYFDYVNNPQFEVIGVGLKVNDGEAMWYSSHGNAIKEWLDMFDLENNVVIMHNAAFDGAILSWKWGIQPKIIIDTLSMARAIHGIDVGNSLAKLSTYYGLGVKGTEVINAIGKHRNNFNSADIAAYGEYCKQDCELTYKLFNKLAPHFNKTELKVIDMTIRMGTEPTMLLDETKLQAHLKDVVDFKAELLARAKVTVDELRSNLKFADILLDMGVEPPMKISPATGKETYAFAKTDEGFKALLEHPDERIRIITEARMGVKTSLEESRSERLINVAKTGLPVPVNLKYYGCTTGRFSADQNLQFQNIPRESNMKKAIGAQAGKVLVGVDLSNIELRVGLYFANEPAQLSLLAEGKDLYREFGSRIYDVPPEDISKDQRFIAKQAALSLIYGVGAKTIQSNILKMGNIDIGEDEAVRIVKLYRDTHKNVVKLWSSGGETIADIYLDIQGAFGNSSLVLPVHGKQGILLPSGLYMAYPELKNIAEQNKRASYVYGKKQVKIYGPKVYQNVTQALARCVMTEAMVRIARKYKIVLIVHDQIIVEASEHEADEAYKFVRDEMIRSPKWAWGLPLDAEGNTGKTLADIK